MARQPTVAVHIPLSISPESVYLGRHELLLVHPERMGGCGEIAIGQYKIFKALTAEWVALALALAKGKLLTDKERHTSETQALKQKQRAIGGTRSRDTTK